MTTSKTARFSREQLLDLSGAILTRAGAAAA